MVENNSVEPDVKKPEVTGCRKSVGWGCLISIVLISAIVGYVMYSATHNRKVRGANSAANSDVKNAYTASQAYFTDYPDGTVSLSKLTSYGFVQSSDVILTVISGSQTNLQLTAAHAKGSKTYTVNSGGKISFKKGIPEAIKNFKATKQIPETNVSPQEETLIYAALSNDISTIKKLLTEDVNINATNVNGKTALIAASSKGHTEIVKTLLEYGADIDVKGKDGSTALLGAARIGYAEVAKLLIINGADVNAKRGGRSTPLHFATRYGQKELAELLIAKGADVHDKAYNGTPLHTATRAGRKELAELLIAKGADVNVKDGLGNTPLIEASASFSGKKEIVELLITNGADVNAKNKSGSTPLHKAAWHGYKEIAEFLIAKGADVNAKEYRTAETPLDKAVSNGQNKMAKLLRRHGGK